METSSYYAPEEHKSLGRFINEHKADVGLFVTAGSFAGLAVLGIMWWEAISINETVSAWADKMKSKLEDPIHKLSPDEKFYARVRVVAAGWTLADQLDFEQSKAEVNVRSYPSTGYSNGASTKIIGKIAQGSEIYNVIDTRGTQPNSLLNGYWGAFDCSKDSSNAKSIIWIEEQSQKQDQPRICAIYGDYIRASR